MSGEMKHIIIVIRSRGEYKRTNEYKNGIIRDDRKQSILIYIHTNKLYSFERIKKRDFFLK